MLQPFVSINSLRLFHMCCIMCQRKVTYVSPDDPRKKGNEVKSTLKCLNIGTPKIINFPFVSNGKLMIFRCPNIQTDYNEAVLCLHFGTPENNEFSIWDKWKIHYF